MPPRFDGSRSKADMRRFVTACARASRRVGRFLRDPSLMHAFMMEGFEEHVLDPNVIPNVNKMFRNIKFRGEKKGNMRHSLPHTFLPHGVQKNTMSVCNVCDRPRPSQLDPFRDTDDLRVHHFCTVCLDALLDCFPLHPHWFLNRELTGHRPRHHPRRRR